MENLTETQKFPTFDPKQKEELAEWMADFQSWIERKIYAEITLRVNWLLNNAAIPDLPPYANNAAAIAGGLTAGDFYRTNGDPDTVCIVH